MKLQIYGSAEPRYYLRLVPGCSCVSLAIVNEAGKRIERGSNLMHIGEAGVTQTLACLSYIPNRVHSVWLERLGFIPIQQQGQFMIYIKPVINPKRLPVN